MKLIMETWRKYLTEDKDDFLKTLSLWVDRSGGEYEIYVMVVDKAHWPPLRVIGDISTMAMGEKRKPCIPDTQEIGTVAVDSEYQKRGIGTYIYEVASYLLKTEHDAGMTSDHSASTTTEAAWVWRKLERQFNYTKRKTPKGAPEKINPETGEVTGGYEGENDKFDYHGWNHSLPDDQQHSKATKDPNDDCYEPVEGVPPSDHSLQIPPNRMGRIMKLMSIQMDNLEKFIDEGGQFSQQDVTRQGFRLFDREYKPKTAGIFQGWDKK